MKRFKNILFFADGVKGSSHTLERAWQLAQTNQARLTVLDIVAPSPPRSLLSKRLAGNPQKILMDKRRTELEHLVAPMNAGDKLVYVDVRAGTAFVEVIRAVIHNQHDLLIKPAQLLHGISGTQLGSTDMHLLRKCPSPVWVDRATSHAHYQSVLAAVDPMAEPDPGTDRLIMDLATSMAARESAQLGVVHAWQLYGESALGTGWLKVTDEELAQALDECRLRHQKQLNALLGHYDLNGADSRVHLVKMKPSDAIRQVAQQTNADLIVMGTVGRTGIQGFIIGNTAEEVIQSTPASVLAVKPADFISPVQ